MKNDEISANFLLQEFYGHARFPQSPKALRKLCVSRIFLHKKIGEITVICADDGKSNLFAEQVNLILLPHQK